MARRQPQTRSLLVHVGDETIFANPAQFAFDVTFGLHTEIESIGSDEDGILAIPKKIRLNWLLTALEPFAAQPILVQTGGTLSDTTNNALQTLDGILNAACDAPFGSKPLTKNVLVSKWIPDRNGSEADTDWGLHISLELSPDILALLKKETDSERLQQLYAGLWLSNSIADTIFIFAWMEINYTQVRKGIVIR